MSKASAPFSTPPPSPASGPPKAGNARRLCGSQTEGDPVPSEAQNGKGGHFLNHASDTLRRNEVIVIAAVQNHLRRWPRDKGDLSELKKVCLKYVPDEMLQNDRVRHTAGI